MLCSMATALENQRGLEHKQGFEKYYILLYRGNKRMPGEEGWSSVYKLPCLGGGTAIS